MDIFSSRFDVVEIHDSLWLYRGIKIMVVNEWDDDLCTDVPIYRSCYGKFYSLEDICNQIDLECNSSF